MKKSELTPTPMPQQLSGPVEVTAQIAWVNPNHYAEVREQVAALRKALEEAATALDDIVSYESESGSRNSYSAQTARSAAKRARAVLLPSEDRGEGR